MATTVYDIARVAGVSRTTVLRALWNRKKVSAETKKRVLKIAAEMNYKPNHIARSLTLGRSGFVALVAGYADGNTFPRYNQPIQDALREAGYAMLFYTTSGDPESEKIVLDELINKRVAGAILLPSLLTSDPGPYSTLIHAGIKVVVMDRQVEGLAVPQMATDHYKAGRVATEYLISLGHTDIVHLAIPETSPTGRQRAKGFRDAMSAAGIPVTRYSVIDVDYSQAGGANAMSKLLKRKKPPTAVVARHDLVAIGAMKKLHEVGLSVPGYMSIIGHGNVLLSDSLRVPLTTIEQPVEQIASEAVRNLLAMLAGETVESRAYFQDVRMIIRESCGPPRQK